MTITTLEAKLSKAGYYIVVDEELCQILVSNNNEYPNHFMKWYSLYGWTPREILDDVIGKPEKPLNSAYDRRGIFTAAHGYRISHNLSMSDALKAAWLDAKIARLDGPIGELRNADRFTAQERKLNSELRAEHDRLAALRSAIVPPVKSEVEELFDLKEKMAWDAFMEGDTAAYNTLRHMSVSSFREFVAKAERDAA